jgi:quinone-modifying oxidoreductase subunit QmoB
MGACPERIVSFRNYSVDMIASMIKALNAGRVRREAARLGLCENDAYPAWTSWHARLRTPHTGDPARCLGSVNIVWIADALSRGYDGILLIGCRSGDDYQCHFIRGSELMQTRSSNIREKLKQLALEEERVRL